MVSIFLAFWFFAKNEKFWAIFHEKRKNDCLPFLPKFFHFCKFFIQMLLKISIFEWIVLNFKKWPKMKKIDFSFFALNFLRKNEKWKNCEKRKFSLFVGNHIRDLQQMVFLAGAPVPVAVTKAFPQNPELHWVAGPRQALAVFIAPGILMQS